MAEYANADIGKQVTARERELIKRKERGNMITLNEVLGSTETLVRDNDDSTETI